MNITAYTLLLASSFTNIHLKYKRILIPRNNYYNKYVNNIYNLCNNHLNGNLNYRTLIILSITQFNSRLTKYLRIIFKKIYSIFYFYNYSISENYSKCHYFAFLQ